VVALGAIMVLFMVALMTLLLTVDLAIMPPKDLAMLLAKVTLIAMLALQLVVIGVELLLLKDHAKPILLELDAAMMEQLNALFLPTLLPL